MRSPGVSGEGETRAGSEEEFHKAGPGLWMCQTGVLGLYCGLGCTGTDPHQKECLQPSTSPPTSAPKQVFGSRAFAKGALFHRPHNTGKAFMTPLHMQHQTLARPNHPPQPPPPPPLSPQPLTRKAAQQRGSNIKVGCQAQ